MPTVIQADAHDLFRAADKRSVLDGVLLDERGSCAASTTFAGRSNCRRANVTDEAIADYFRLQGAEPQNDDRFQVSE